MKNASFFFWEFLLTIPIIHFISQLRPLRLRGINNMNNDREILKWGTGQDQKFFFKFVLAEPHEVLSITKQFLHFQRTMLFFSLLTCCLTRSSRLISRKTHLSPLTEEESWRVNKQAEAGTLQASVHLKVSISVNKAFFLILGAEFQNTGFAGIFI